MEADTQSILDKLAALPLAEWNYIGYPQRHVGPMAQDFHAAFPWSGNDTSINSADETGVALAAIQALKKQLDEQKAAKDAEVDALKKQNAEQARLLLEFRLRLEAVEKR